MSLVHNNPIISKISGMLGKTVVFRMWRGRMVMSNRPKSRASLSVKQQLTVDRFKEASQYAVKQMKDPAVKADYVKGINFDKHSAYLVALCDFLNAPKVVFIKAPDYQGAPGDWITIKAMDDFKVTRVTVVIVDSDGVVLEQGDAVPSFRKPFIWKYQASVPNPNVTGSVVRVTAFDKPGNSGTAELML